MNYYHNSAYGVGGALSHTYVNLDRPSNKNLGMLEYVPSGFRESNPNAVTLLGKEYLTKHPNGVLVERQHNNALVGGDLLNSYIQLTGGNLVDDGLKFLSSSAGHHLLHDAGNEIVHSNAVKNAAVNTAKNAAYYAAPKIGQGILNGALQFMLS